MILNELSSLYIYKGVTQTRDVKLQPEMLNYGQMVHQKINRHPYVPVDFRAAVGKL